MLRLVREAVKRAFPRMNDLASRFGVFVLPNHYYTSFADPHDLRETVSSWGARAPMYGVDMDPQVQAAWLRRAVAPFQSEYEGNPAYKAGVEGALGPGYGYIEAQCLHGVLRHLKPKRVIEVGSGVSTGCILHAARLNEAEGADELQLTCVEPYPRQALRALGVKIVQSRVEALGPEIFDTLEAGDLLFIDSSHAVRVGGDVLYLYLRVIPRLKPGVIVHIHDIYLPYLHQRDQLRSVFQWTETALLLALLTNNAKLRPLACLSLLHYEAPLDLAEVFPEYVPQEQDEFGLAAPGVAGHYPSAIYLQAT